MAAKRGTLCGVCTSLSVSTAADKWCPECDEAFCSKCLSHHSVAKATREHEVITVENYEMLPDYILKIKQTCETHGAKFQNYCRQHERPCCRKCIDTTHKKCQDLPPLDEVIGTTKSSFALENLMERIGALGEFYSYAKKETEKTSRDRQNDNRNIEKDIKEIRQEINRHLDTMVQQILQRLSEIDSNNQERSEKFLKEMMIKENRIAELAESLQTIKQYASDLHVFLGSKTMEQEVIAEERIVAKMSDDRNLKLTTVSFETTNTQHNIIENIKLLGKFPIEEKPICIVYQNSKKQQAQATATGKEKQVKRKGILTKARGFQATNLIREELQIPHWQPSEYSTPIKRDQSDTFTAGGKTYTLYHKKLFVLEKYAWRPVSGFENSSY